MLTAIKLVKDKVRYLLTIYPQTRDCDASLYCSYLINFGDLKQKIGRDNCLHLLDAMKRASPPESIRRIRQKIQEGGELQGTKREKRLDKEDEVRYGINNI
jgi:hypothetical protein